MDDGQQEQYLRNNGWIKVSQFKLLWNHRLCDYDCCTEVAILITQYRNKPSLIQRIWRWMTPS